MLGYLILWILSLNYDGDLYKCCFLLTGAFYVQINAPIVPLIAIMKMLVFYFMV
jgi:hypothetical protein